MMTAALRTVTLGCPLLLAVKANAEILTVEYEAVLEPALSKAGRLNMISGRYTVQSEDRVISKTPT